MVRRKPAGLTRKLAPMAWLAAVLAFLAMVSPARADCQRPLTVGFEHYPPFLIVRDGELAGGIDAELMDLLSKRAGCAVLWVPKPWKRHLAELRAGRTDLATSAYRTGEREGYVRYSIAYRQAEKVLFVAAGLEEITSVRAFLEGGYKLGLVRGYDYGGGALAAGSGFDPQIEYVTESTLNLRKLVAGRIDGTIEERLVFLHIAQTGGREAEIRDTGIIQLSQPMHLMFSKASLSGDIVARFDAAIRSLTNDGSIEAVLKRYQGL